MLDLLWSRNLQHIQKNTVEQDVRGTSGTNRNDGSNKNDKYDKEESKDECSTARSKNTTVLLIGKLHLIAYHRTRS